METFPCHQLRPIYYIYGTMLYVLFFKDTKIYLITPTPRQTLKVDYNNERGRHPCYSERDDGSRLCTSVSDTFH